MDTVPGKLCILRNAVQRLKDESEIKFTRFSVSSDEETGHSELMIYGVQHADAGKYKCSFRKINSSNSQTVDYTLTVIG